MGTKGWMYLSTAALSLGITVLCRAGPDYTLRLYDSWGDGNGGEFRAEWTTANGSPAPRSTGTAFQGIGKGPAPNRFEAFCLEMQEFISLNGSPYSADLNTTTVSSEAGGQAEFY